MAMEYRFTTDISDEGSRLDFFVATRLSCGHRNAKRLIVHKKVTVNGKERPAHYKLAAGAEVAIVATPDGENFSLPAAFTPVAENADYAIFHKPGGLHTVSIAGSPAASLENALASHTPPVALLSRLDRETSGLVAAAFSHDAAERFKKLEAEGKIRKEYIALVYGVLSGPLLLQNALDTHNRKTTRVLEAPSEDAARFTEVRPLSLPSPLADATLVAATIKRGARHQIRAHLAFAGHPIVGDPLYGKKDLSGPLFLHHARLTIPGLTAFSPPPWLPNFLEELLLK